MPVKGETIYCCPENQMNSPLIVELAGITHPDAGYRISRPAVHDLYVLEYVIRGRGHVYYGDRYFSPEAGDVYFLQPHASHKYYADPSDPWEKIWFNLKGPLMFSLCEAYHLHGVIFYHNCPLQEEFFKGLDIVRSWPQDAEEKLSLQIHLILKRLHDRQAQQTETGKSPEGLLLKEYLDRNWQQKVTVSELAGVIRRSPAQMMRIFRKDWNDSPCNYQQKLRDFFSRQYLENTNYPIKELALLMGFKDEFYFSNWFKQRNKLSPTRYRSLFR